MKKIFLAVLASFVSGMALAVPPNFTTLTAAVDYTTATAAILLVMAGLAGVYIVMGGGSMILAKLKSR